MGRVRSARTARWLWPALRYGRTGGSWDGLKKGRVAVPWSAVPADSVPCPATPPFAARLIPRGHAKAAPLREGLSCAQLARRFEVPCGAARGMLVRWLLKKGRVAWACVRRPCGLCPERCNTPLCRAAYPQRLAKASPLRGAGKTPGRCSPWVAHGW